MTEFTADIVSRLAASGVPLDVFLFVDCVPPGIRVWTGPSEYNYAGDATVDPGGTYDGFGKLAGFPELNQLINGTAERVEFTLSGVSADAIALADENAAATRNAPVFMGVGVWDDYMGLLGSTIWWVWEGTADAPRVVSQPSEEEDGAPIRQIILSVGSLMTSRRRARYSYWTDIGHQADHPGDTFFGQIALYNASTSIRWPT